MSLFTTISWPRGRKPRRARLLERLDSILPWHELESLAAPLYPAPASGRPPYPLRLMVRVWVLQFIFGVSDESGEDLLLDAHSAASFVGIDPWRPRPPGATAIRNFRLLVDRVPGDAFRLAVSDALISAGADLRLGQIREPVLRIMPTKGIQC
ncbi:MAG: transposase [Sulfuritalea sp.]|nr:transposase [Sulfuritalea sp.]